jgi:outer membrane protein OmpA-like peptidoglycan-associated protein
LVGGIVSAPACVTKKRHRQDMEQASARVSSVESAVEANERRVSDLSRETDEKIGDVRAKSDQAAQVGNQALGAAREAGASAERALKGRLLWEVTLTDDRVKFSFDQAELPAEAAQMLDDLAAKVKGYGKAVYVEIEGHTDGTGSEEYNYELGERRANAVRDYLAAQGGIPLHAMNVISYGESRPLADNSTSQGRAQNRRVVIRVLE